MSFNKLSIQFFILMFSIFTLNACGGKSTKADAPVTESETHSKCDGKCDKEKCDGKCDKEKCDGKCDKEKCDGKCDKHRKPANSAESAPESAPESASSSLPNDGTRVVGDVTKCPVSGNAFTVAADSPKVDIEGKVYYLCCAGCVDKFKAEPAKYL